MLSNTSLSSSTYPRAPKALNPAIGFSTFNLRPVSPPAATSTVTIGLIYLIIIAFLSFTFFLPIHMQYTSPSPTQRPLKFSPINYLALPLHPNGLSAHVPSQLSRQPRLQDPILKCTSSVLYHPYHYHNGRRQRLRFCNFRRLLDPQHRRHDRPRLGV